MKRGNMGGQLGCVTFLPICPMPASPSSVYLAAPPCRPASSLNTLCFFGTFIWTQLYRIWPQVFTAFEMQSSFSCLWVLCVRFSGRELLDLAEPRDRVPRPGPLWSSRGRGGCGSPERSLPVHRQLPKEGGYGGQE